jgi:multiple sugar transport system permease protein
VTAASLHYRIKRRTGLRRARAWPFLVPIVVWILVMFGYPIYDTIRMAFSYVNGTDFTNGAWKWAGFENFRTLPYLQGWTPMLRNTGLFIAGSVIPQLIIGGLLAVTLRENSLPRRWARSLVLLPWLFPAVATATTFLWMFESPAGLFDSIFKSFGHSAPYFLQTSNDALIVVILVNIWIGIPFNYLVVQSGLQTIPPDLHEAAVIDGCSWWQELTRVTIPLLRETILTVLMLGIAGTMNVFAFVWILTMGGPADATMLPGPLAYTQAFVEFNYGQGAAIILGVVAVLLCVAAMFLIATRPKSGRDRRTKRSAAPAPSPRKAYA